jgi:TP901 family phage tail tape measure protein
VGRKQFKDINMADFANLVLGVDTSGLKRGERDLKSFGAQGERTERKVDKFGTSAKRSFNTVALAATAALGAIVSLGSAVRVIAEFETSMSRLGAVSRATGGELEALRDIAKDLGSTTEFSASQAADGLNFLAMAGFNATEAMAAIPSVLDLATASGLGLAEAADTASNIMSGFGIAAADAAEVADVLAAASTRANTTVGQLGAAMSTVAPIASALDMSLEDTAAAIGVLSDAGIQGERAGTGLRGVLASLAGPTTQAEAVLRGLGLTIADVDPATNELSVVMARLGAAGLSTADAMTLFGREAASGALVLIDGAQRVGDFGDELERADGAAGDMAKTMRDNLGGDLKGAMSAAQGLAIALGDAGLTAIIRAVVQTISGLLRGITGLVDGFAKMSAGIAKMFGFANANDQITRSAELAALAIAEEVKQGDNLLSGLIEGREYSVDYVGVKLAQAQAHLATADAIRLENIEAVKNTQTFIDAAERQAAFNADLKSYYKFRAEAAAQGEIEGAADAARYRVIIENIQDAYNVQLELLGAVSDTSPEVVALQTEIDYINTLLDDSVDGVVKVEGGLNDGTVAASDLALEVRGIASAMGAAASNAVAFVSNLGNANLSSLRAEVASLRGGGTDRDAFEASLRNANEFQLALTSNAGVARLAMDGLNKELEAFDLRAEKAAILSDRLGVSLGSTGTATDTTADAMQRQIEALEDAANPMRKYNREMAKLNKLMSTGDLSKGAYAAAVEQLSDELEAATDAANGFASTFKDGITDALDYVLDGMKRGMDGLMDILKKTIMDMIKYAIMNPINLQGGMNMAGGGGGGMMSSIIGGGGSAGGGMLSTLGMGGGLAGSFLAGGAGLVTSLTGAGGGLAAAGTYMSAVTAGATASIGGLAAAAGAIALPLLAVAAVFMFFKKKTRELDAGMRISVDGMESLVEGFKKIETSRFFGLSKKVADEFEAMDAATADPLQNAVNGVLQNVFDMATGLGVAASTFDDFTTSLIVSLKGLDEAEAQVAIQDALRDIGVEFAEMATDLFEFQRHGENAAMILDRLNTSVEVANGTLETLGLRIFDLTLGGANAASVFLDAFVSLEAFNNASILYYDKFFSNAEKMASATALMTDEFAEMGFELPRTRDQFRQLLEAQDMTTESGRQAVAVLLQVSGAFDELTTQLDNLNANLASALNGFASGISAQKSVIEKAVDALVKPLEDAINRTRVEAENSYQIFKVAADKTADSAKNIVDIIRGTLDSRTIQSEVVELQRYQRAQRQLASFAGGSSFDETSLTRATEGVSINSQKFFGSFEDYARDFYKTQISLTSLAEKAEGELSDVETQIAIAEKAYQIAQGTYQEAQDFNVALDNLLFDLASFTETSARNQPFIDQIKAEGERQIALLDAILVETTKQVNGFLGIENSVADLAGSNVSVAEALGILGIEENEMSGAVIALKTPVAEIGSHIAALDTSLGGAYDRLGITLSDLESLNLASSFDVVNLAAPFGLVDLSAPFKKLDLTGALETKVKSLGDNVVLFSSALTLATGGLGINVTNLGTTIDASMVSLGTFLNSLTASIKALSIAQAAVPTPVIDLYTDVLGRTPDELGLAYWRSTGLTGQALKDAFRQGAVNSGEVGSLEDLPQFATGGMHSGGPRIVGEHGAELEVTGPSRIYNNADTKKMFSGGSEELIQELRNLRQEVTNLRNQNRDIGVQAVKYGKKLYDLNREWDIVGLPPIRTA